MDLFTTSPALSLPLVLRALREAVARWGGRGLLAVAVVLVVHRRLGEICRRVERLAVRFGQGLSVRRVVRAACVTAPGVGDVSQRGRRRGVSVRVWPAGFAWMVKAAAHEAAGFGLHMRAILAHPDMVALLAAAPEVRRLLTPVCVMLGVETNLLRPPGEIVEKKRPVGVAGKVPAAKRRPEKIKLPRGVLTAARRAGFAKAR